MKNMIHRCFNTLRLIGWLVSCCVLLSSCSGSQVPSLQLLATENDSSAEQTCSRIFVEESWQFVHSLEVSLPGNQLSTAIGITNVNPGSRELESIVMSVEGLVLFHSRFNEETKEVLKSIDPFSSEHVSDGLMNDIRLIFLKPDGSLVQAGWDDSHASVCRYRLSDNTLQDIRVHRDNSWEIVKYDMKQQISRTVKADPGFLQDNKPTTNRFPALMNLKTHGLFGYALKMTLLQVEPVTP